MYTIDLLSVTEPNLVGTYPSMYNNFLTSLIMSDEWALEWLWPGIFKYYDMFSVQGWANWFYDFLSIISFFYTIQFMGRIFSDDWYWLAPENDNSIDMNALFPVSVEATEEEVVFDPFDFSKFEGKKGPDCNGNMGVGNYCFCEQEGFHCDCKHNSDFGPGQIIKTCYDYFGYDCEGNYVDGVKHWCTEKGNTFTYLNE